ncbi:LOW QUALITY PROTEIN: Protein CBG10498, partial [Caenorhabditis briggsae]
CNGNCELDTVVSRKLCPFCKYDKCLRIGMKTTAVLSGITKNETQPREGTSSSNGWAVGNLTNSKQKIYHFPGSQTQRYKLALDEIFSKDIDLIHLHLSQFFQSITPINDEQRKFLGHQFIAPFALLDGAWRSHGSELFVMPNGDYVDLPSLNNFYQNP